jgi:hypothetical protein
MRNPAMAGFRKPNPSIRSRIELKTTPQQAAGNALAPAVQYIHLSLYVHR